jgi:hypothetical protein
MPAVPFGGLSFFLNAGIVIIGAGIKFLEKKGFALHFVHKLFFIITGRRFDYKWRRVLGYSIMLATFFFLFVSIGFSFAVRMNTETNLDLIANYYQTETMHPHSLAR